MKIFIFGGPGSGKTTIASKLSLKYNIPFFELDSLLHTKEIRAKTDQIIARTNAIKSFIYKDNWISEGVYRQDWLDLVLKQADLIFILKIPKYQRDWNIVKRTIKRMFGIEVDNNHESNFKILLEFFKFNSNFEKERYLEIDKRLKKLNIKPIFVKNYQEIVNYVNLRSHSEAKPKNL